MDRSISKPRLWLLCFALSLPSLVPFAMHHYLAESVWGRSATGFVQYDQSYYMANARQHFDEGEFTFAYKNPNDYRHDSPRIYSQLQSLTLGAICKYSGANPAYVFFAFGWLFAILTIRVAYSLLNEFLPLQDLTSRFVFALFIWGGGLFSLTGLAYWAATGATGSLAEHLVMFDPFEGWWFLNLGRNLIFPLESYYHFLFLLGSLFLVQRKFAAAAIVGAVVAASHPFTGVEYLAVMFGWLLLEKVFWQDRNGNWFWIAIAGVLLTLHVGYYQFFLSRFEAHREIHEAWQLAWEYKALPMLLAYGIVGAFAAVRLRTSDRWQAFLRKPKNRYLLVWFAVAFLLANHEFFMKSTQPLHFTRGYVWMPLFLAGSPVLYWLCSSTNKENVGQPRIMIAFVLGLILLLDNLAWLPLAPSHVEHNSLHTSVSHQDVMEALNAEPFDNYVVVSNSLNLSYLATTFTHHDSFVAHYFLTPNISGRVSALRGLVDEGEMINELADQMQLFVLVDDVALVDGDTVEARRARVKEAYESSKFSVEEIGTGEGYVIWKCVPKPRNL